MPVPERPGAGRDVRPRGVPACRRGSPLPLTLAPHGFLWFTLEADPSGRGRELREATSCRRSSKREPTLEPLLSGPSSGPLTVSYPATCERGAGSVRRRVDQERDPRAIGCPFPRLHAGGHRRLFNVEFTEGEGELYVLPLALVPRWPTQIASPRTSHRPPSPALLPAARMARIG